MPYIYKKGVEYKMADNFRALIEVMYDTSKSNKQLQSELKQIQQKYKLNIDTTVADKNQQALADKLQIVKNRAEGASKSFNAYTNSLNPKAIKNYSNEIDKISDSFKKAQITGDRLDLSKSTSSVSKFKGEMKEAGLETKSFTQELLNNSQKFASWYILGGGIVTAVNTIKDIIVNVKELDDSLVELRKVSDLSGDSLVRFTEKAYDMGAEVARTGKEVIDATTVFKRAGYTLDQSFDLAKVSLVMTNVGDGISNVDEASSALIATLKGFKLSDTDAMKVIDMINSTSNQAAIDFDNITEGLRRVSGTLSQTGTSIQQTIGLLTGGFGSLRDIEMVSSGLIMISQRLRGIDEDGQAIEGLAPKLKKEFKDIANIDIEDENGNLRSTYDILQDMARVFPTLTSKQKQYLGELAAGNRQIKVLNAIVGGWNDVTQAVDSATNSQGSAMKENDKVLDSISGKINAFKSEMQELSFNTLDSDAVKFFVDLGTGIVKVTNSLGGLVPVLSTVGGIMIAWKSGLLPTIIGQTQMLMLAQTGYTATTTKAAIAQIGFTGALKASSAAMKSFLLTNPVGQIILLTSAFIGLIKLQDALTTSLKEQQAITEKLQTEYQELETKLSGLNEELETTAKRIDELNGKDALTIIEQDELSNLKETNAELETQIGLLKEQATLKGQEVAESVAKEYAKDMTNNENEKTYWTGNSNNYGYKEYVTTNEEDYIKNMVSLMQTYNSKKERGLELTKEESDYYTQIRKELVNYGVELYDYADRYKIDDEISQSWRDFGELIDKTLNPDKYKQETFENIYNGDSFKKAKTELEALAKSGELSPETLSSNKEYQRLIVGTGYNAEQVVEHINAMTQAEEEAAETASDFPTSTFETLNKSLDTLEDKSKDTISSLGDLNQILYDQAQGEKLTAEQVYSLLTKYPQLSSAIEKTSDGYTINTEAVNTLREAMINQEKANATAQINMTTDTLNGVQDRLELYGIELEGINSIKSALSEQNKLPLNGIFGSMEGWAFDDATKRVSTPTGSFIANATATEYDAIKKAYDDQKLIYDSLGKLGELKERANGLQSDLLTGKDFGITDGSDKGKDKGKETDPIKEAFDKKKNDIDNLLALDKITQDEYYNRLEKLNNEYFGKNKKKYLEEYRKNQEDIYKGRKQINENSIKSNFDNLDYEHEIGNKTDEQYWTDKLELAEKYYTKNGKIIEEYLDEYRDIQSGYYKWTQDQAEESAKKQEKIAENLKDKYTDLISDIADEIEKEKDAVLDNLEETHDATIKNLEEEKDSYKEIIDTQLELLDAKKKQNDYEKSISKQTGEISKIESRKAELEKAAKSGDRTAIAELAKLDEELAEKKEDLSDEQADHEYDLQKESLQNALDLNDKLIDAKIKAENSRFETQKSNIEKLYNQEIELINKAAQYTKTEFGKVLDEIATKLAGEGVVQSSSYLADIKKSQSGVTGTQSSASTSTRTAVLSIVKNGKGKDYGEDASDLAAYTRDNFGAPISKAQAVEVAKLLGVSGINSVSDLTGNDANKKKILDELKKLFGDSTFANGGIMKKAVTSLGETGIGLFQNGEALLTKVDSKVFRTEFIPIMKDFTKQFKLNTPDFSKVITNNNSSPTTINVTVPVTGSIDSKNATNVGNNIAQQVAKLIIDVKRTK